MPDHIRTLVVILVLATIVFLFARPAACAHAFTPSDFARRRNTWYAITLSAFLAHNFWVFILFAALILLYAGSREPNKPALFFFILFAVSPIKADIPGFGIVNLLFTLHYPRLLSLALLLPAYLYLRKQSATEPFGKLLTDKIIIGYVTLNFFLMLTANSLTNSIRLIALYSFTDIFLPYYVTSRALRTLHAFRETLMAFVIAAMVLAIVGCFEAARGWLLYDPLERALDVRWSLGGYLDRGETLRAIGSTGQPIALGYVIAVGIGLFLYLKRLVPSRIFWTLGMALLVAGIIAPLSRGPWVGAVSMLLIFLLLGPSASSKLVKLGLVGLIALPAIMETSVGEKIISYLPFIGTVEESTITYRQRLLEIAIEVILQNPLYGASNYFYSPVFQELRTGSGFLDMVNSYIGIGLSSGLLGLFLFCAFFIATGLSTFKAMRAISDKNCEMYVLGQALIATLVGILVIIFTVSSISIIPIVYWAISGVCVAYSRTVTIKSAAEVPKNMPSNLVT